MCTSALGAISTILHDTINPVVISISPCITSIAVCKTVSGSYGVVIGGDVLYCTIATEVTYIIRCLRSKSVIGRFTLDPDQTTSGSNIDRVREPVQLGTVLRTLANQHSGPESHLPGSRRAPKCAHRTSIFMMRRYFPTDLGLTGGDGTTASCGRRRCALSSAP